MTPNRRLICAGVAVLVLAVALAEAGGSAKVCAKAADCAGCVAHSVCSWNKVEGGRHGDISFVCVPKKKPLTLPEMRDGLAEWNVPDLFKGARLAELCQPFEAAETESALAPTVPIIGHLGGRLEAPLGTVVDNEDELLGTDSAVVEAARDYQAKMLAAGARVSETHHGLLRTLGCAEFGEGDGVGPECGLCRKIRSQLYTMEVGEEVGMIQKYKTMLDEELAECQGEARDVCAARMTAFKKNLHTDWLLRGRSLQTLVRISYNLLNYDATTQLRKSSQ